MSMSYGERKVSEATGIEQTAFCFSILMRMHDDCRGVSHLTADEFKAAAIKAASDMFPAAMGAKK